MNAAPPPLGALPNETDIGLAREATRVLARFAQRGGKLHLESDNGRDGGGETVALPASAIPLLRDALGHIAGGHAVTVIRMEQDLTTQEAAALLNVSRPYLVGLLEHGRLPFHKVGTHRRIRAIDLLAFKGREQEARCAVLDELTEQAQALGLGY